MWLPLKQADFIDIHVDIGLIKVYLEKNDLNKNQYRYKLIKNFWLPLAIFFLHFAQANKLLLLRVQNPKQDRTLSLEKYSPCRMLLIALSS